jgi:PadR family transcriptional regulator, regulatory protein PadR
LPAAERLLAARTWEIDVVSGDARTAIVNSKVYCAWTRMLYLGRVLVVPKDGPLSPQSTSVIAALAMAPTTWRHGYDLAKQTGLKSGTLYPILIRLAERGLVEAQWENEQPQGRPRRHLYRLTATGRAIAGAVPVGDVRAKPVGNRPTRRSIAIQGAS